MKVYDFEYKNVLFETIKSESELKINLPPDINHIINYIKRMVLKLKIEEESLIKLCNKKVQEARKSEVPKKVLKDGYILKKLGSNLKRMDLDTKDKEKPPNPIINSSLNKISEYKYDESPEYHLEDIFTWKDGVYYKVNDKPMKFIVNDKKKIKVSTIEIRCKKNKQDEFKCSTTKNDTHGNIAFKKVTEYIPIFKGAPRKYKFKCIDAYKKEMDYTGTFNEIVADIDADGYIYEERKIKEILKKIKELLQKQGLYNLSKLPPYPGFFLIDNKIQTNQKFNPDINKDKLKEALELLDTFANFFEENKNKLGYILHWIILAPFNFAMKQAGNGDLLGSIYLVGKPNSGKTTVGFLTKYIWGTPKTDTIFTAGRVDTVARFGAAISNMTYPVVFDEGSIIFDVHHKSVFDLYKSSIYDLTTRTVMDSNRKSTNIPALSSIIFTSNYNAPKEAASGRRTHTIEFSVDHPRTQEERNIFNQKLDPDNRTGPMKILNQIGNYVADFMLKNPDYIKKPWLEVANEIIRNMYESVDLEIREWVINYEMPKGLEEAWHAETDRLFIIFKELLLRNAYTKNEVYNGEGNEKTNRPRTPRDKAEEVIRTGRETWVQLYTPKKGKNKDKELVVIDAGIVEDMEKEYHLPYELKRIAEDLEGTYTGLYIGGKTRKVACWELDKFLEMFGEK